MAGLARVAQGISVLACRHVAGLGHRERHPRATELAAPAPTLRRKRREKSAWGCDFAGQVSGERGAQQRCLLQERRVASRKGSWSRPRAAAHFKTRPSTEGARARVLRASKSAWYKTRE